MAVKVVSFTLKEVHRLRVFRNSTLRRVVEPIRDENGENFAMLNVIYWLRLSRPASIYTVSSGLVVRGWDAKLV